MQLYSPENPRRAKVCDSTYELMMIYPDGEQVTYGYNSRMLLDTLAGSANYVTGTEYDAAGRGWYQIVDRHIPST